MAIDGLSYQSGFGNALASEAESGALPTEQNGPRDVPFGLYAEQINGTGFTVHRAENHRVWMYRLRPQLPAAPFARVDPGRLVGRFDDGVCSPDILRFAPVPQPEQPTDFVAGLRTVGGNGDPRARKGMALHVYAANADMVDRVFANADGDFLLVPELGSLEIRTELGRLHVSPGEIAILPRGLRFAVRLLDGVARGWVSELFEGHHRLPERGVIGANGLADERHFLAPVADYEDREVRTELLVRQGGELWRSEQAFSPFDVVAWHGSYAPFKYDLMRFVAYWSVTVDHADPSVLTVLTAPQDSRGRNVLDFVVFRGRWDVTEHSFRPPFFHRNAAMEFNAVVKSPATGPYRAGASTYTPPMAAHGVSVAGYERAITEDDTPHRLPDEELWVQWESALPLRLMPWTFEARDPDFLGRFQGFEGARIPDRGSA